MENAHQQPCHYFSVGDVCVDRSKYSDRASLAVQRVQIRKFNGDGSKAIVHYVHCPMGMVFAVDVRLLNAVDTEGFLRPSPYMGLYKRSAGDMPCAEEGEKRMRKE